MLKSGMTQASAWAVSRGWNWTFRLEAAPQVVPVQTFGDRQSALDVHVVLHAVAPQTYGLHELVVAARQVPVPSHVRGALSVEAEQAWPTHCVPVA
jgi:hypothetical protein